MKLSGGKSSGVRVDEGKFGILAPAFVRWSGEAAVWLAPVLSYCR